MATGVAGKNGSAVIGDLALNEATWNIDVQSAEIDITSFASSGNKEVMAGIESLTGTVEGFMDGASLTATLSTTTFRKTTALVSATFTANDGTDNAVWACDVLVTNLNWVNSVDGAVTATVTFTSSGAVTQP